MARSGKVALREEADLAMPWKEPIRPPSNLPATRQAIPTGPGPKPKSPSPAFILMEMAPEATQAMLVSYLFSS
jgi:hypothetical protein